MIDFLRDHPDPDSKGLMFYRCMLCSSVVSIWDIKKGGCPKCAGTRVRPTNLSFMEKLRQILKHPKVWTWKEAAEPVNLMPDETTRTD